MPDPVIVSAVRTPIGAFGGYGLNVHAADLGATAIKAAMERARLDPAAVEEVLMGCVLQAGLGMNVARQSALKAGIPTRVPAFTINKMCGSGLKAVALAAQAIRARDAEVLVAGGTENMSRAPYLTAEARFGARMGDTKLVDSMLLDGLVDAMDLCHMGITAENVAEQWRVSREEQDEFAARSQQRAVHAMETGLFDQEIVGVTVPQRRGDAVVVTKDEHPRPRTTAEKLAKLPPAFRKDGGTVTAGNASGVNDGAAAIVVMSDRKAAELGLEPLARIRSYGSAGVEPRIMGIGPVPAIRGALRRADVGGGDIDLWEVNEAFAAQAVAVGRELEIPPEHLKVNGGAIALGHPIGASGTRVLVTLLHEMGRRDSHLGVAGLCIGGGMGIAAVVENGRGRKR
jgi:acetyl-CoA C-acetyltransferase